jgi:hypothetical protein
MLMHMRPTSNHCVFRLWAASWVSDLRSILDSFPIPDLVYVVRYGPFRIQDLASATLSYLIQDCQTTLKVFPQLLMGIFLMI